MALTATFGITSAAPQLRRVRREEVARPAFDKPDPYARLMACWVDYMRVPDLHLSSRGMKLIGDAAPDATVGEAQYIADLKLGESVNAMIDSLTVQYRWAIYKSQGISTAWRFPNANYELTLSEARDDLEKKLRNNVATRLYFS